MIKSSITLRALQILVIIGFVFVACKREEPKPKSNSINKIMVLGASRVEGARPEYESFRYELWKLLVDGEWTFDFVGTMTDEGVYPEYKNQSFDPDHEGRGGWTSTDIEENIDDWLVEVGQPDLVLFSSPGGNDILNGLSSKEKTVENIALILDKLRANNPQVIVLMEDMAPMRSDLMTEKFTNDFNYIQKVVDSISVARPEVYIADMKTDFSDSYLADDVHYNEQGARFIAQRYYSILANVLE